MKHATNGEVLLFKRPIEQKFSKLLTGASSEVFSGLNEDEVVDFEFISNPQAIQTSVKNTFGYVRSRNSSGTNSVGSAPKQPPISRPTSSNSSGSGSLLNSLMNGHGNGMHGNGLSFATLNSHSAVGNGLKEFLLEQQTLRSFNGLGHGPQQPQPQQTQPLNNNVFDNGLLSKRFSSSSSAAGLGPLGGLGTADLSAGLNPYEKWSNGSDKLFDQHTSDSILELSSKLLNLGKNGFPAYV